MRDASVLSGATYQKGDWVEFRFSAFSPNQEGVVTYVERQGYEPRYFVRPDGTRQVFPIAGRNVLRRVNEEILAKHPGLDIEAEIARVEAQKAEAAEMKSRW